MVAFPQKEGGRKPGNDQSQRYAHASLSLVPATSNGAGRARGRSAQAALMGHAPNLKYTLQGFPNREKDQKRTFGDFTDLDGFCWGDFCVSGNCNKRKSLPSSIG